MHKIIKTVLFCHFILISFAVCLKNMSESADQWASMIINELFPKNETQNRDLDGGGENENTEQNISLSESDLNPSNATGDCFNGLPNPNEDYSAPEFVVSSSDRMFDNKYFDDPPKCSFDFDYSSDPHLEYTNLCNRCNSSVEVSAKDFTSESYEDVVEDKSFDVEYGNITESFLDRDDENCVDLVSGTIVKQYEDKLLFDVNKISSKLSINDFEIDYGNFGRRLSNAAAVNLEPVRGLSNFAKNKKCRRDSDLRCFTFGQSRGKADTKVEQASKSQFNRSKSENFKEFSFRADGDETPGKTAHDKLHHKNRFKSKSTDFTFDSNDSESEIDILKRIDEKLQELKNHFFEEEPDAGRVKDEISTNSLPNFLYEQFARNFIEEESRWARARHEQMREEDTFEHPPTGNANSRKHKTVKDFESEENLVVDAHEDSEEEFEVEDSSSGASYECRNCKKNRKPNKSLKRELAPRLAGRIIETKSERHVKMAERNFNTDTRSIVSRTECLLESNGRNESKKIGPTMDYREQRNVIPFRRSLKEKQISIREDNEEETDDEQEIKNERVGRVVSFYRDACAAAEVLVVRPFAGFFFAFAEFFAFVTFLSMYTIYKLFRKVRQQSRKCLSDLKRASSRRRGSSESSRETSDYESSRINESNKVEDSRNIFEDMTSWSCVEPKDVLTLRIEKATQNFDFLYDKGEKYLDIMKKKHSSIAITTHEDALINITLARYINVPDGFMPNASDLHMTVIASSGRPQRRHLTIDLLSRPGMVSEWKDTSISIFATNAITPDSMLFETARVGEVSVLNSTEVDGLANTGSSSHFELLSTLDRSGSENASEAGIPSEASVGEGGQDSLSVNVPSFTSRSDIGDFSCSWHSTESFGEHGRESGDYGKNDNKLEEIDTTPAPWLIDIPKHLIAEPLFCEKNEEGCQVYLEGETQDVFLKANESENANEQMHTASFGRETFDNNLVLQELPPQSTEEMHCDQAYLRQCISKSLDGEFCAEEFHSDVPLIPSRRNSRDGTSSGTALQQDSSKFTSADTSSSGVEFGPMEECRKSCPHPKRKKSLRRRMSLILDNWKGIQVMQCMSAKPKRRKRKYKPHNEDS